MAVAFGDYTVFRTYQAVRRNSLGADTSMELHEIYQNWVFPDGRMVILSRDYSCGMFTGPSWNHYSDFKPKKYNSWSNTFEVRYNYYAPGWKVSRLARRNGWRAALREDDVCPIKQLQNIMHPIGEMLVKNKQYRIFNHWTRRGANDMDDY